MGKKSKSSRRGAAARPATNNEGSTSRSAGASSLEVPTVVDWKTLDLSKCCLCHVSFKDLPNYTYWLRYGTFILKTCCGSKICCFCRKKHNGKIDAAERRVNELMSSPRPYFNQVAEAQRVFNGLLKCPACKADHLTDEGQVEAAQRLAKDKHPIALDIVGCHYINGTRLPQDINKGIAYLAEAFERGNDESCTILGRFYDKHGDFARAKLWYEKSSPRNAEALLELGNMFLEGRRGIPVDRAKAIDYISKSAELEYPLGIATYAGILSQSGNPHEALEWYLKGAHDERSAYREVVSVCQFTSAMLLSKIHRKNRHAIFWAQRAERNGHFAAAVLLAQLENTTVWKECGCCKSPEPTLRCGGCQAVAYCNEACQKSAWQRHKKECKDVPAILTNDEE